MPRVTRSQSSTVVKKQGKISSHFQAKRNRTAAKRLKTSNVPENTFPTEGDSGCSSNYQHKAPARFTTPSRTLKKNLDVDQTSVDGYQILTPPSTPCSHRVRTTSENSTSSIATTMSSASTKENKPPATGFMTPSKRNISAISGANSSTVTLAPLTPLKSAVKRRRRSGEEDLSYDFTKSPKTGAEGVSALTPLLKRKKSSASPRSNLAETDPAAAKPLESESFVEKSTPVEAETPTAAPKKLSLKERLAAVKAKNAAASLKREQAKNEQSKKETPRPEAAGEAMVTPKPSSSAVSRLAGIKARMAARKSTKDAKATNDEAKAKVSAVLEKMSPMLRVSEQSRKYIRESYKNINVDEKLRTLELPKMYKIARNQFKHIDQSVQVLHNRRQTILANRVLRDAGAVYKEYNFSMAALQTVSGLKEDAYQFSWKRGLRTETAINEIETSRIKSDNFQLTIKPTSLDENLATAPKTPGLGNHTHMNVSHVQSRLKDFTRRLLVAVYEKHRAFNAKLRSVTEEQEEKDHPLDGIKRWHPQFSLQTAVRDLKDFLYELPPKPLGTGSTPNNPATPISGRKLLNSVKNPGAKSGTPTAFAAATPPPDNQAPVVRPAYLDSPDYKALPKSLQVKYEERMRKAAQKSMLKEEASKLNEVEELKSLYDVARGLKSYYIVKQTLSGNMQTIAAQISKSSKTLVNTKTTKDKLRHLASLQAVKESALIEIVTLQNGTESYIKMKATTKLQDLKDAIDLAVQRKEQNLGL